jgi:hypothetical protein
MHVTPDQAAKIYARACRAWYGPRARRVVQGRVQEMHRRGDRSGIKAWEQVAAALETEKSRKDATQS